MSPITSDCVWRVHIIECSFHLNCQKKSAFLWAQHYFVICRTIQSNGLQPEAVNFRQSLGHLTENLLMVCWKASATLHFQFSTNQFGILAKHHSVPLQHTHSHFGSQCLCLLAVGICPLNGGFVFLFFFWTPSEQIFTKNIQHCILLHLLKELFVF